jgi:hypothetical protein
MSSKIIDSATAEEHLRDGQDSIKECVKTLKRVQKSFPEFSPEIDKAIGTLGEVRTDIAGVASRLVRA